MTTNVMTTQLMIHNHATSKALLPVWGNIPGTSHESYLQAVNAIPVLDAAQERALAERYFFQNDVDAARQLVMSHLRFVVHIARSYKGYGLPQADLVQEGNVGLMKAVKRFDPTMGVRLVSFAVHWIKAEIHEFVLRNWRIVKVATTKAQRKLFFNLRSQKKRLGWMTQEEMTAVAQELGVTVEDVREMEGRLAVHDAAFDAPLEEDDDGGVSPVHYLEAATADPAEALEQEDWENRTSSHLQRALAGLDARSREILEKRWLAEEKATLHDLAAQYQVSAERIRQLEQNAMRKLKQAVLEA